MASPRDLRRDLKRIDKRIKQHNDGSGFAYDLVINDRGAVLRRWQAKMDKLLDERTAVVTQINAYQ